MRFDQTWWIYLDLHQVKSWSIYVINTTIVITNNFKQKIFDYCNVLELNEKLQLLISILPGFIGWKSLKIYCFFIWMLCSRNAIVQLCTSVFSFKCSNLCAVSQLTDAEPNSMISELYQFHISKTKIRCATNVFNVHIRIRWMIHAFRIKPIFWYNENVYTDVHYFSEQVLARSMECWFSYIFVCLQSCFCC